jgi:hypothetical protein
MWMPLLVVGMTRLGRYLSDGLNSLSLCRVAVDVLNYKLGVPSEATHKVVSVAMDSSGTSGGDGIEVGSSGIIVGDGS